LNSSKKLKTKSKLKSKSAVAVSWIIDTAELVMRVERTIVERSGTE